MTGPHPRWRPSPGISLGSGIAQREPLSHWCMGAPLARAGYLDLGFGSDVPGPERCAMLSKEARA